MGLGGIVFRKNCKRDLARVLTSLVSSVFLNLGRDSLEGRKRRPGFEPRASHGSAGIPRPAALTLCPVRCALVPEPAHASF